MNQPVQKIALSPDGLKQWTDAITKARAVKKTLAAWWDANLEKYSPDLSTSPENYGQQLNTNRDFTLVERKKPDLFYQRPDVNAVPSPLFEGQEALLDTHTKILNEKLGLDGVNAKALVHRVLFDVLCTAGTGWTIMGYDSATIDTPVDDPVLDPAGQPVTGPDGQPLTQPRLGPDGKQEMAPVPVYEDCYWRAFSPKQALKPHDFYSTDWDEAPWLGMEFEIPVRVAKRKKWVDDDFKGQPPDQDLHFDHGLGSTGGDAVAKGTLIYYKSALYRDDRVHPLHYTLLILMDGAEEPADHKDSPLQTLDPQGRLTPDSVLGNPIHPLTIRTLTDASDVPSDCTISRPLVNELNTFRGQMVQFRDASILRWSYNVDTLPADALGKIVRSPIGGFIGLPAEAFVGEGAIKELPHGSMPRESFTSNDYIDNDLARTHGIDNNASGASSASGDQTATEAQLQQSNVNARLGFERGIVLDWYCKGVTKYSAILQRFMPLDAAAKIVGPQKAQEWDSWRKQVPASLAFTALPDAALRTDLATERKRRMEEYTYWANDPFINRAELLKQTLPYLGYGPKVLNPQPPEKSPEPTKPGLSLKGEDLNPLNPQFPILVEVLGQCGIKISPQAIQQAQEAAMNQVLMQQRAAMADAQSGAGPDPSHGGKVAQMESLDKHQVDQTGGMQGTGQPAPMGTGGSLM